MITDGLIIPSLRRLAASARESMSRYTDADVAALKRMKPLEVVRHRYLFGDCPEFAAVAHFVTGWPVKEFLSDGEHSVHYVVQAPDGRYLDASGWITPEAYAQIHGFASVTAKDSPDPHLDYEDETDEELMEEGVGAMRLFTWAPFNEDWFRAMTYRPIEGVELPPPRTPSP